MVLSGGITDYVIAFTSGVVVSFTPCVYPVMPMTASFIAGANIHGTRWRGFVLSLVYVFGMAFVYAGLAVFAALTGKIFGQVQNSGYFYLMTGLLLVFFALMMFDKIVVPAFAWGGAKKIKPDNLWSVLLFGMVAGLVVSPCTVPFLVSLLIYVASKQNVWLGMGLLFVFAYGVGFSLICVGTFSGLLSRLPKSGQWLVRIKQMSGLILFAMGLFFIYKGIRFFI